MIVHNVGPEMVESMIRVDVSSLEEEPPSPFGRFDFNDSQCGVASFTGSPPWEFHSDGDELLHILSGHCHLIVRNGESEETRALKQGDIAVVPKACWHRNHAPDGGSLLYMTPKTGNRHDWNDPQEGVT